MYLDFYGFREKPFNLTPDPRFVFLSKNHREAFAHLLYRDYHSSWICYFMNVAGYRADYSLRMITRRIPLFLRGTLRCTSTFMASGKSLLT